MQFCFVNLRKSLKMHVGKEGGHCVQTFIFSVSILQICRFLNSIFSRHTRKRFVLNTQWLQEKHDSKNGINQVDFFNLKKHMKIVVEKSMSESYLYVI